MAHKFIKKNGKYYRINSDNTQTEVELKDDGYFHWTQPDKIRVKTKLDNNLTDMDKSDSLLSKIGKAFTNATIGASVAEAPAIQTANGWYMDDGWKQDPTKPGVKQLQKDLATIGAFGSAVYAAPFLMPGTVGGTVIGNAAGSMALGTALEEGQRAIAGQSTGDIVSSKLQEAGVHPLMADAARPEYYINPTGAAAKAAWNAGSKAVQSVKSRFTPKSRFGAFGTSKTSEVAGDVFIDNPVALHMSRLENGGWDKLVKMHKDNPYRDYMLAKSPRIEIYTPDQRYQMTWTDEMGGSRSARSRQQLESWLRDSGGGMAPFAQGKVAASRTANPMSERQLQAMISHEMNHALHVPPTSPEGFDFSWMESAPDSFYFTNYNGSELAARGSQIKDWLGFTRADQEITPAQLKAAAKHYVNQTGINNNMTDFFKSIVDWEKAAKWLSKNATAIGGLGVGTTMFNQTNKDKDVQTSR